MAGFGISVTEDRGQLLVFVTLELGPNPNRPLGNVVQGRGRSPWIIIAELDAKESTARVLPDSQRLHQLFRRSVRRDHFEFDESSGRQERAPRGPREAEGATNRVADARPLNDGPIVGPELDYGTSLVDDH